MADAGKLNPRGARVPSKLQDCFTGDELDLVMSELPNFEQNDSIEIPSKHTQVNGEINNVSFKTMRVEKWIKSHCKLFWFRKRK